MFNLFKSKKSLNERIKRMNGIIKRQDDEIKKQDDTIKEFCDVVYEYTKINKKAVDFINEKTSNGLVGLNWFEVEKLLKILDGEDNVEN